MYGIYANIGGILMVNVTIAYMDPIGLIITDMHHSKLEAKCSEISEPNPEDPQLKPQLSYRIPQCAPSCAMLCPPWDHPKSDREKFNAPLLKSVIDCVVFGHDLDFSNDKSCNDPFKATAGIRSGWELQIA